MFFTTSETEGEVGAIKLVKASPHPTLFITDRSNAVVLLWFFVDCFWCQCFGDVSPYVCSYYFSSVSVAEWPPFGK